MIYSGIKKDTQDCARLCAYPPPPELEGCPKGVGVRLYLERIPIAAETRAMAEELNADPIVAVLNGGEDYELMFTVPLEMRDKVLHFGGVDVIGHVTKAGAVLVTPDGGELPLTAPGFEGN